MPIPFRSGLAIMSFGLLMGLVGVPSEAAALPRDPQPRAPAPAGERFREVSALPHSFSSAALGWDGRSLVIEDALWVGRGGGLDGGDRRAPREAPRGLPRQAP